MTQRLRRYAPDELIRFLTALDASLHKPAKLTVIGGSALALGYGGSAATSDIDTYESELDAVQEAAERASAETGLHIPISNSMIAQLPAGYEERLVRVLPDLTKLEVRVLDSHDLAASKLLRGNEHDRQQLAQLHALAPLDLDTLVARYRDLIADYVGDPTEPMLSLRHLVQELWGEIAAVDTFGERTATFASDRR